jgi:hypothetical protein
MIDRNAFPKHIEMMVYWCFARKMADRNIEHCMVYFPYTCSPVRLSLLEVFRNLRTQNH